MLTEPELRIGIDLGGTKIAGIAMDRCGTVIKELRQPTPRQDYVATLKAIAAMIENLTSGQKSLISIGIGIPGSIVFASGSIQNANSTWLNRQFFVRDLQAEVGYPIKCANDANCFILSEAHDGNAVGVQSAFGVILGTGCGGGLIIDGYLVNGPRNIGGEWGHNSLPWPTLDEVPGPRCWCGRHGCLEVWVSGPGLVADHARVTSQQLSAETIVMLAASGDRDATDTLARHASRLARGLAHVVNILDPHTIVLGGGLCELAHLYQHLPPLMAPYIFSDDKHVDIRPPKWGAASGVRGAARL